MTQQTKLPRKKKIITNIHFFFSSFTCTKFHPAQTVKYAEVEKELADVRGSLVEATSQAGANADEDDLDAYMNALQAEAAGRKKAASQLRVIIQYY